MFKKFVVNLSVAGVLAGAVSPVPALAETQKKERPRMDLAFCIDTTSSMQGEIDMVKTKMKELVAKLSSGKPTPDIRVGLVAYRDRGDDYVTKVFPFSDDIDKVVKDISGLQAQGGGDGPEAVNQGLHSVVHDLKWDTDKKTAKLIFLIGDAGPHFYPNDYDWHKECKEAISQGIQINTIGCDGLQSYPAGQGVDVFQGIAKLADGKYETLAYKQEVATADGHRETVIRSAGAVYKVKSADKEAWRAGAVALAAGGKAERMDSPVAAAAPMALSGKPMARAAVAGYGAPGSAFMSESRSENNLADVLLSGAKDAAKKKIGVEFGR
jgi:Mg-chelatase subunit ChlD